LAVEMPLRQAASIPKSAALRRTMAYSNCTFNPYLIRLELGAAYTLPERLTPISDSDTIDLLRQSHIKESVALDAVNQGGGHALAADIVA
jgi:hypothetical protein